MIFLVISPIDTILRTWSDCSEQFKIYLPLCIDYHSQSPLFLTKDKKPILNPTLIWNWFSSTSYFDNFPSFCQLLCLHEWGHYQDTNFDQFIHLKSTFFQRMKILSYDDGFLYELNQYKIALIDFENRAWDFVERNYTSCSVSQFKDFKNQCLLTYEDQILTLNEIKKRLS